MKRSQRGLLARHVVGALLVLLSLFAIAPSNAQAGCSPHYVLAFGGGSAGPSNGLGLVELDASIPDAPGEAPRERRAPCTGAFCSGSPATPTSTAPTVPPPGQGQWALITDAVLAPVPGPFAGRPFDVRPLPIDRSASIFHPPRLPFVDL